MYDVFSGGWMMHGGSPWGSMGPALFPFVLLVVTLWSLAWKGIALWYAARGGEKIWFVALLIVNTLGVLEILYIFFFREEKRGWMRKESPKTVEKKGELPVAESSPVE